MFFGIEIIGLVGAIVVAILAVKAARERRESKMWMALHAAAPGVEGRPQKRESEVYHDEVWLPLCNMIAGHAVRLGRPLSAEERARIWRSRSSLVLETLLKEVEMTNRAEVLERGLADLPPGLDRPDPTGWCEHGP